MTSIDSFPDDDIERVVYLYSCLKLNTSSESDNILIEVLLVEIDAANINRLKISENSYNKYDVTANSNMRCDSFKSHMIINKLSKFL